MSSEEKKKFDAFVVNCRELAAGADF